MTPDEISILNLFVSCVLAGVTAIYVILTYYMLKQMKESNERSLNMITFPYISCDLKKFAPRNDQFIISLKNLGSQPAYDVEIILIGIFYMDINEFNSNYVKEGDKLILPEKGHIGIFTKLIQPILPSKKQLLKNVHFPFDVEEIQIFVQYRNALKTNYALYFDYFDFGTPEFSQTLLEQDVTKPIPRLDIKGEEKEPASLNFKLVSESREELPDYLKEFSRSFSRSTNIRTIKNFTLIEPLSRGTIKDLENEK